MSAHDIIYSFVSSFIALFPVVNPIGSGFIINGFLQDMDDIQRKSAIKKIITNCLLVGIGSLIAGHLILLLFGLAVPVIQVGGGIVICKTGLEWLSDSGTKSTDNQQKAINKVNIDDIENKLFYPISFPIALGPGSISVIFTLMAAATVQTSLLHVGINYFIIVLSIISMLVILYIFLKEGPRIMKKIGSAGNMIINKMVAFITFCIGIQILIKGIAEIFHLKIM